MTALADVLPYLSDDEAAERIRIAELLAFQEDPALWIETVLGEHLWSAQRQICDAVVRSRHVAVVACHDVGKSWLVSRLICWFINAWETGENFCVASAPSHSQIKAIVFREIRKAYQRASARGRPLRGTVNQLEVWQDKQLVAFGRKPSDLHMEAFSGVHARRVLTVLDEASGIPESLWDAAETLCTNEESKIVAIGNPTDESTRFYQIAQPGSGWDVVWINALDSPNVTGEAIPDALRPMLVSPVWIQERKERWGEESPLYRNKILGQFCSDSSDVVVPLSWVRNCQHLPQEDEEGPVEVQLGVDVGRGGDLTVIYERRGRVAGRVWTDQSSNSMSAANKVVFAIRETGASRVVFDKGGVGQAPMDRVVEIVREQGIECEVLGVNAGHPAADKTRFSSIRAEMWWEVGRENSEQGTWNLARVSDDTVADLIAPKFRLNSAGKIQIEEKKETLKRLGRSPDHADALLLAFYSPQEGNKPAFLGSVSHARPAAPRTNPNDGW